MTGLRLSSMFALGVLLGAPVSARAQASRADTVVVSLADAERRALANSPALADAVAQLHLSEAQRKRASGAKYLPEFKLRNVWGPIPRQRGEFNDAGVLTSPDTALGFSDLRWFTQLDLTIVQPLLTFGKISSRVDAAGHGVEVAEAGLEVSEADVLLGVRQLYWGVVLGNELGGVMRRLRDRVAEAEDKLNEQYEKGEATQNDMFKFTLFKYEVGRRGREVQAGVTQAREGLRAMIGLPSGVPIRVEADELLSVEVTLDSLDVYIAMAEANRPELRQLQAGIAARRSLLRAEERDRWPSLFLAGGLSMNVAPSRFDPRNPFWRNTTNYSRAGAVLGVEWDLNFLSHKNKASVQRYETLRLEARVDPLLALVEKEVRAAYLRAKRAQADAEEGRAALRASENWLRAELQTYDIGVSEIKDVIDAFQANVQMETLQLRNIADFNQAVAELNRRVGRDVNEEER
jgi:outer membrane protein TolC